METLKNLATCTPREFFRQTAKIRKAVQKWLTLTDIMNIRKRLPEFPKDATEEEKEELIKQQSIENVNAMLDSILDEHPDESVELLGLCCFLEPEEIDKHTTEELLMAMNTMLGSEAVLGFFTSLVKLAQTNILNV